MADNRSDDKRSPNTVDAIDESHILSELERIGARTGRKTGARSALEGRIAESGRVLNALLGAGEDIPEIRSSPLYNQQVPALQNRIRSIRTKMNSLDMGSQARAESEASTLISRQFDQSTINAQAGRMAPLSATMNMAAGMSGMNYDQLYEKRENTLASIASRERKLLGEVPGTFNRSGQVNPEKSAMFGAELSSVKDLIQELAAVNVAMKELGTNAKKAGEGLGGVGNSMRASAYSGMFSAAGGAAQEILVGQRMTQVQNQAGFASWENQKYDMYKKARGGDVMSQLLLARTRESEKFGTQLFGGQQGANALYAAGGAAQTAAGYFQAVEGGAEKANLVSYALGTNAGATQETLQGGVNMVQGGAITATVGMDIARQGSAGQAKLAGMQGDLAAKQAILQVGATQLQGLRDFSVGQGNAAMNMGAAGEDFLQRTVSKGNMDEMIKRRISPDQFNQMSTFGAEQIGSTFNESQVFSARGYERSGYGSTQLNMQRMSSLASAGANNPQAGLGSVMEAAFSKGLEGSKVLNAMVENTAALVQGNAIGTAAGVDTTQATATLLAGSVGNEPNREFAAQRAMTAQEVAKSITTDTSASFAGMINTARIAKTTGIGMQNALFAAKLSPAQIRAMQDMTPGAAVGALVEQGVGGVNTGNVKGFLQKMQEAQTNQMFTGNSGLGLVSPGMRKTLAQKASAGVKYELLSPEEQLAAGQIGNSGATPLSGREHYETAAGFKNAKVDPNAKNQNKAAAGGEAGGDMRKTLDDLRTSGFAQLSEAAKQATKDFKTAGDAVAALGKMVKEIETRPDTEGEFSEAGAKSAATFGKDAVVFGKGADKLNQAADKLLALVGINNRVETSPSKLLNELSKTMDSKHGPKGP